MILGGTTMRSRLIQAIAIASVLLASATVMARDFGYDPEANPFEGYRQAIAQAQMQNKLVLVVAGGEWCYWCRVLDGFVARNSDVKRGLDDAFVVLKVYVGEKNYNELFFSQLPRASGAPYFWIVSPDRSVLSAQSTRAFEARGDGYDKGKFLEFVRRWKEQSVADRKDNQTTDAS
jgi:uncharacterized protein YyaL (SSP411 family)